MFEFNSAWNGIILGKKEGFGPVNFVCCCC